MCGIGGLSTNYGFGKEEASLCWGLLESLQRRGTDAWGYYDGHTIYKEPGAFEDSAKADTLIQDIVNARTNIFLCHTRKTTQGDPEHNPNNHPFELDDFVFAHNGILYATEDFDNTWDIDTDSFWLLYWIAQEYQYYGDVPEAIRLAVRHVIGHYACWLWDSNTYRTYLFREENPIMTTSFWSSKNIVLFGSDWFSIIDGFKSSNLEKHFKFDEVDIKPLTPRTIYMLKDGQLAENGHFTPRPMRPRWTADFWLRQGAFLRYHRPRM